MHIDQETRNKLREKQYELQPSVVGVIVEHRVQDPTAFIRTNKARPTGADISKSLEEAPRSYGRLANNKESILNGQNGKKNWKKKDILSESTAITNGTPFENNVIIPNGVCQNGINLNGFSAVSKLIEPIEADNNLAGDNLPSPLNSKISSVNIDSQPKISLSNIKPEERPDNNSDRKLNLDELPIKIEDVHQNNWAHMDQLEFDKLAWIMKEDRSKIDSLNGSSNQARFDMDGKLVVQAKDGKLSEIPTHLGLHHHGDEPELAGYTIEELLCYLRSSYERQRVLAMNVLGNIASWAYTSFYDNIFDINIASMVINEAILSVRINLDSTSETTVVSALRCLHAFICNTNVDELILDKAFPLLIESPSKNLWLEPKCWKIDANDTSATPMSFFTDDMSDGDCVQRDPIAALVERTELITRLRYLLDVKLPIAYRTDHTIHDYIFDILIRIARHSPKMCAYLSGYPHLLLAIEDSFLPLVITSDVLASRKPSVKALKFIRVLATADLDYQREGIKKGDKQNLMDSASHALSCQLSSTVQILLSYIFIEPISDDEATTRHCVQISIEALRCWSVFLQLKSTKNEMTNYFTGVTATIKNHLTSIKKLEAIQRGESEKINLFDWQFAAALINVVNYFTQNLPKAGSMFLPDICYIVFKWTQQIIDMNMIPNINVSLAITSGIDFLVKNQLEIDSLQNVFLRNITDGVNNSGLSSSCLIKLITRGCLHRSPILISENYSGCLRDSANLPSFGCILFNRTTTQSIKITPFLEDESPFLLFRSIIEALTVIKCPPDILTNLFKDRAFHEYLTQLRRLNGCTNGFESDIKSRLFEQCELLILSKALICICDHYLSVDHDNEIKKIGGHNPKEKLQLNLIDRLQCYDNLFVMSMSCISLLTSKGEESVGLRHKLLTEVILNPQFNKRMIEEKYPSLNELDKMDYNLDTVQGPAISLDKFDEVYVECKFSDRLWPFEPLINYFLKSYGPVSIEQAKGQRSNLETIDEDQAPAKNSKKDEENIVLNLNLIEMICKRSKLYSHLVLKPNLEDCLCLVGTVFLSDGLFLDKEVSHALKKVILTLLEECMDPNDFDQIPFQDPARKLRGINLSVNDFFIKLVEQYEGASYGDPAFSNFLMLFLTHKSHSSLKRYLLSEKSSTCINQFRIVRDDLWIPETMLFSHKEKDVEISSLYRRLAPSLKRRNLVAMEMFVNFHIS